MQWQRKKYSRDVGKIKFMALLNCGCAALLRDCTEQIVHFFGNCDKDKLELFLNSREREFNDFHHLHLFSTHFRLHHLRTLITHMFQCCGNIDFSCSFANPIQDHVEQDEGASASDTIARKPTSDHLTNTSLDRDNWLAVNNDRWWSTVKTLVHFSRRERGGE